MSLALKLTFPGVVIEPVPSKEKLPALFKAMPPEAAETPPDMVSEPDWLVMAEPATGSAPEVAKTLPARLMPPLAAFKEMLEPVRARPAPRVKSLPAPPLKAVESDTAPPAWMPLVLSTEETCSALELPPLKVKSPVAVPAMMPVEAASLTAEPIATMPP